MKPYSLVNQFCHSSILRAAVVIIALAWINFAFCDEIHDAAQSGDLKKVMALLQGNPNLVFNKDDSGNTPLLVAAWKGQKFVVEYLLESKAEVNAKDNSGETALHKAANSGYKDVVIILLAHQAEVNATNNDGDTPLHQAAISRFNDSKGVVEVLLENKAEVNIKNNNGVTPLHCAAASARINVVALLLANKAEVNAKDSYDGETPLNYAEYAEAHGDKDAAQDVEDLLREHGGKAMPPAPKTTPVAVQPATVTVSGNGRAQTATCPLTSWQIDDLTNYQEQVSLPPEVVSFIASKEKLAHEIAAREGFELGADLNNYYAAINAGRIREAQRIRFGIDNNTNYPAYLDSLRQVNLDITLAFEQFSMGDPELAAGLGKDFMDSLPASCIYFGGTDPGRGLPTMLCNAPGDPIFVLTQNALCSSNYIQYVRDLYGSHINLPRPDEVKVPKSDNAYDQMRVMATNALIAKRIFDENPDREFYYEQSFPLDWMYPYLTPHGVVMKLNRTPLDTIPADQVEQDTEFWSAKIKQLQGNPKFATDNARKAYSGLRYGIASVYLWRSEPQKTKDAGERQRMFKAAEKAFQQSLELFSTSPGAVYGLVNLEMQNQKFQAALDIAKAAVQADPSNQQFKGLVQQLEQAVAAAKPKDPVQLEKEFNSNPTNFTAGFDLAHSYLSSGQTNSAFEVLDKIVGSKDVNASALGNVAGMFSQLGNLGKLETVLTRMTEVTPDSPEIWYDLAALKSFRGKKAEALADLKKALELNSQRLQTNPSARDLAAQAAKDPRFDSLKNDPDFQRLLPQVAK
jgi:ankyrin repeat protein/thioredoxin-like negative regulator of GroEL